MLRRGLGRAVLFLEQNDARAHRKTILKACLQDQCYDRQCEEGRAPYLFDVLHATGEPGWYARRLRSVLEQEQEDHDGYQIRALCALLIRGGEEDLRPSLYAAIEQDIARGERTTASVLIGLDGLRGYRFVAERLALQPPAEDPYDDWSLLDDLIEKVGEEPARQVTTAWYAEQGTLTDYLRAAWEARERHQVEAAARNQRLSEPLPDYEMLRAHLHTPGTGYAPYRRWGRELDEAILQQVARDFLMETDSERCRRYLRLFAKRAFPLEPTRLIELARGPLNDRLTLRAHSALEQITHPAVRALGLEFARTRGREAHALGLLVRNADAGTDIPLVESLLSRPEQWEDWEYHHLGMDARHYFEEHPTADATRSLLFLYEHGPCSLCRTGVVKLLAQANAMPEWMRRECQYDADAWNREMATEGYP